MMQVQFPSQVWPLADFLQFCRFRVDSFLGDDVFEVVYFLRKHRTFGSFTFESGSSQQLQNLTQLVKKFL